MPEEPQDLDEAMTKVVKGGSKEDVRNLLKLAAEGDPLDEDEAVKVAWKNSNFTKEAVKNQLKSIKEDIEKEERNSPNYEITGITVIIPQIEDDYRKYIFHVEVEGEMHKVGLNTNTIMTPTEFIKSVFELTHTKLPISQEEWDEFLNDEFDDLVTEVRTEEPLSPEKDVQQEVIQTLGSLDSAESKADLIRQPDSKYYCNGEDVLVSSHLISKIRKNVDRTVSMRRVREAMDDLISDNTKHIGNSVRAWYLDKEKLQEMGVNLDYE